MKEIREILDESKYEIISMKEAGVDIDIVEDGKTFEENALIKAKAVMEVTGQLTLADDSGLETVSYTHLDVDKRQVLKVVKQDIQQKQEGLL